MEFEYSFSAIALFAWFQRKFDMALHFERTEFEQRISLAREAMRAEGLSGLLIVAPESQYYLTGYDTSGYVFFQCLVLTADEQSLTLLTRLPDYQQALRTSIVEDVRLWYGPTDADPSRDLQKILKEKGLEGESVGIEMDSFGLSAAKYDALNKRFAGWCKLQNASHVVRQLRLVKSPAELVYVRRAAELADDSLIAMLSLAKPGSFEGEIAAVGQHVILVGGGDPAPSGPVLGSGEKALLVRASTGFDYLRDVDQLTLEFAASYRRYCACLMRTAVIGKAHPKHQHMFDTTKEALVAMTEAAVPGRPLGDIDRAHRRIYDQAGYSGQRLASCGYSLGATFRPIWMDTPPLLQEDNETLAKRGMTLFLHAILIDSDNELAMSLGHTIEVTEHGAESMSNLDPEFQICGEST